MAIKYDPKPRPGKGDLVFEGESLTEQEHQDSCDINLMIKNVHRGLEVHGKSSRDIYGYDDTTMDGVQHRIQKERLEKDLSRAASEQEFTEDELKHVPPDVKSKFGFKVRKASKNDDQTTKNEPTNHVDPKTSDDGTKKPV